MTLTVIWCFLLCACELIHIFVCGEKICNNYAENICHYCTKFSYPGNQAPSICALLVGGKEGSAMGQLHM
jgi:hypothetical protein